MENNKDYNGGLYGALSKAQGMVKAVHKTKVNPQFRSKYASLDDILEMLRPICSECGIAIIQIPVFEESACGVKTVITHSSGDSLECGELLLPLGRSGGAQGAGSSLTYARRYAISALFCISCDDDDDGNTAQKNKPAPKPERTLDERKEACKAALKTAGFELTEDDLESLSEIDNAKSLAEFFNSFKKEEA
jgi:hypothetical protein